MPCLLAMLHPPQIWPILEVLVQAHLLQKAFPDQEPLPPMSSIVPLVTTSPLSLVTHCLPCETYTSVHARISQPDGSCLRTGSDDPLVLDPSLTQRWQLANMCLQTSHSNTKRGFSEKGSLHGLTPDYVPITSHHPPHSISTITLWDRCYWFQFIHNETEAYEGELVASEKPHSSRGRIEGRSLEKEEKTEIRERGGRWGSGEDKQQTVKRERQK